MGNGDRSGTWGRTSLTRSVPTFGSAESDPAAISRWKVDLETSFVNDYLVMEPAENDEIFLICLASSRPGDEMMDLETTTRVAPVGAAHVVVVGE